MIQSTLFRRLAPLATVVFAFAVCCASASAIGSNDVQMHIQSDPPFILTNASAVTLPLSADASSSAQVVDFYCSFNNAGFAPCNAAPPTCAPADVGRQHCTLNKSFDGLAEGLYYFAVREVECPLAPGLCTEDDYTQGPVLFNAVVIDQTPATVTITSGPSLKDPALGGDAAFNFGWTEVAKTFCSVDGAAEVECEFHYAIGSAIANGEHVFKIRAVDAAGNQFVTTREFLVDRFIHKVCPKKKAGASKSAKRKRARCMRLDQSKLKQWEKKHPRPI